jgi:hypothetical protein
MKCSIFWLASIAVLASELAKAGPITYTDSGVGFGSLNGTAFADSLITLTFEGDTANVTDFGVALNQVGTLTLNIASLGTAIFTDAVQAVDNPDSFVPGFSVAGFGDNTTGFFILGTQDAALTTYDLKSSIGPITGIWDFNAGASFGTNHGAFVIQNMGPTTFSATTAPEPATMALFGFGLLGVAAIRQRR